MYEEDNEIARKQDDMEDESTVFCSDCVNKDKTMDEQPCFDCLEDDWRPMYERRKSEI